MKFHAPGGRLRAGLRRALSRCARLRAGASIHDASRPAICSSRCAARTTTATISCAEVLDKGAAAVVVERPVPAEGAVLRVADTLEALQTLAGWARRRWGRPSGGGDRQRGKDHHQGGHRAAAGDGDAGGQVHRKSEQSRRAAALDSAPGRRRRAAAVLEIGMNHAGEIRRLAGIARPDIGVVTNVGHAHVEFFAVDR